MGLLIGAVVVLAAAGLIALAARKKDEHGGGVYQNRIGDGLRRLQGNMAKYAVMSEALLAETEDEALLEAVLSNLWAKMAEDLSDAVSVMRVETRGRRYVYAIYAVTGGVMQHGFKRVKDGADAEFLPVCAQALEAIGAAESAAILRDAEAAENADAYTDAYLEAFSAENGKEKLVAYIRANTGAFTDPS